jgi:CheY-like chemotaxis protein
MQSVNVLLVEDDPLDSLAVRRAFQRHGIERSLFTATDGQSALEMLRAGDYVLPRPCIVILDENLPRMNGLDLLEQMRRDPRLPYVDVYMLTNVHCADDEKRAERWGTRAFLFKDQLGPDLEGLFQKLKSDGYMN